MRDVIVASMVLDTVKSVLELGMDNLGEDGSKSLVRIKDLKENEIHKFLEIWEKDVQNSSCLEGVTVVLSPGSVSTFPEQYYAKPDHSITWYRNHNTKGLVYIDTATQSDEQGIKEMFTLRDSDYLDEKLFIGNNPVESMLKAAWKNIVPGNPSSVLSDLVTDVMNIKNMLMSVHSIPMRNFVEFVESCARYIADVDGPVTAREREVSVGKSLVKLNMFPDDNWALVKAHSVMSKRLVSNYYFADLMNNKGSDFEPENMAEVVKTTLFKEGHLKPLSDEEQQLWRERCIKYIETKSDQLREDIPYDIFNQLFNVDTSGLKLGDRVDTEIRDAAPDRYEDFANLEFVDGLNERNSESAREFLEYVSVKNDNTIDTPFKDFLAKATVRMLIKLAYPTSRKVECPLIELLDVIKYFEAQLTETEYDSVSISIKAKCEETVWFPTLELFGFMYGNVLADIAESSRIDVGSIQLDLEERLTGFSLEGFLPYFQTADEDEEDSSGSDKIEWSPLGLEFSLVIINNGKTETLEVLDKIEWFPNDIKWYSIMLFWLMSDNIRSHSGGFTIPDDSITQWHENIASAETLINELVPKSYSDVTQHISDLSNMKEEFANTIRINGLNVPDIDQYVNSWSKLLNSLRKDIVPSGSTDETIKCFMKTDLVFDSDEKNVYMIALHPIRMRWVGQFFGYMYDLLCTALSGNMHLNVENETHFLEYLGQLSPYQHPAMLGFENKQLFVSSKESGWGELFQPMSLQGNQLLEWSGNIDVKSLQEIKQTVLKYIEFHPYKDNGISLLTVLPGGGQFAVDLYRELKKSFKNENHQVTVHLFTPKIYWQDIIEGFDSVDMLNRIENTTNIFPPLDLKLHDWEKLENIKKIMSDEKCDMAIVPNLFGNKMDYVYNTESENNAAMFKVLSEPTSYVDPEADKQTVSVVMKPRSNDGIFEDLSTLSVRLMQGGPVAPDHADYNDYVKLQVKFQEEKELFEVLHDISHWVVTLDHYVGREQIESLQNRPDVLTVKNNIGSNGMYTMVVSSNAGKEYIKNRLGRRLKNILDSKHRAYNTTQLKAAAEHIYDTARNITPFLVLRAMGLSRVTEEMTGLALALGIVRKEHSVNSKNGLSAWISLDEYSNWFGGHHESRADLCRISIEKNSNDTVNVHILVLESKLRQQMDLYGVDQVKKSMDFFKSVFQTEYECKDSELWRRDIFDAIENISNEARKMYIGGAQVEYDRKLSDEIRYMFLEGNLGQVTIEGVYSICNYQALTATKKTLSGEVVMYEVNIDEIWSLNAHALPKTQEQETESENVHDCTEDSNSEPPAKDHEDDKKDINTEQAGQQVNDRNRLSLGELNQKYQLVLDTYASFGISVEKPTEKELFIEGPAFIQLRIKPGIGVSTKRLSEKSDDLKLALALNEEQELRFVTGGGTVNIDVPKQDDERYYVGIDDIVGWQNPNPEHLAVALGENQKGEIVAFDFSDTTPHLLIAGTTGSGKSEALNTILYGLTHSKTANELKLLLVDPKGTELSHYEGSEYLQHDDIGLFPEDAIEYLKEAVDEMQRRYTLMREQRVNKIVAYNQKVSDEDKLPWWLLVLDEYADLTSDTNQKKEIEDLLKRIVAKGRASGIHVIVATQKPSGDVINTTLRANLGAQLALKVKNSTESRVVMDEPGAEALNGKGDAFLKTDNKTIRIQCAKV